MLQGAGRFTWHEFWFLTVRRYPCAGDVETARELAGEKDISITGANVAQQFITHGLLDEISIHFVPVLYIDRHPELFSRMSSF
jgi:dihydrofolate reductase